METIYIYKIHTFNELGEVPHRGRITCEEKLVKNLFLVFFKKMKHVLNVFRAITLRLKRMFYFPIFLMSLNIPQCYHNTVFIY